MAFTVISQFKTNQLPATGITTATIDIIRISDGVVVVNDGAVSETGTATGVYVFVFAAYDPTELYSFDITTNAATDSPTYGGDTSGDVKQALTDIDDNLFDPATDTVANVTLVATTTTNTDMRGTDGANTVAPDNTGIATTVTNTNRVDALIEDVAGDQFTQKALSEGPIAASTDISSVNGIPVTGPDDFKADVTLLATAASITTLTSITEIIRKIQANRVVVSGDQQTVDVYEDNGTTIAFSFSVAPDGLERTPV